MDVGDHRSLPSSSTSALSAAQRGAYLVNDIEELDDATLKKILFLAEHARKQRHLVVVASVMTAFPLYSLFAVWPPFAIPVVVLGGLIGFTTSQIVNARVEREAKAFGIDPRLVRTVERKVRRMSSRVPRWVKGAERIEVLRAQMRTLIDDQNADKEDRLLGAATRVRTDHAG